MKYEFIEMIDNFSFLKIFLSHFIHFQKIK